MDLSGLTNFPDGLFFNCNLRCLNSAAWAIPAVVAVLLFLPPLSVRQITGLFRSSLLQASAMTRSWEPHCLILFCSLMVIILGVKGSQGLSLQHNSWPTSSRSGSWPTPHRVPKRLVSRAVAVMWYENWNSDQQSAFGDAIFSQPDHLTWCIPSNGWRRVIPRRFPARSFNKQGGWQQGL